MRVVIGGVIWFGPPCSSWGWVGRRYSLRSVELPTGDTTNSLVRVANRVMKNVFAIAALAYCRGLHMILETPHGSLVPHLPNYDVLEKWIFQCKQRIYIGAYGADTQK